jgi:predicted nucleic acid-binding protein
MSGAENLSLDTNVVVYNFDHNEPVKGPQAQALLVQVFAAGQPLLSTQVLSEFYWTVTRKIRLRLSHDEAVAEVNRLKALARVVPVTWEVLEKALEVIARHGMSLWDAQIFASAVLNSVTIILSEDFQHGRTIEGVTFLNPFAADFEISRILSA